MQTVAEVTGQPVRLRGQVLGPVHDPEVLVPALRIGELQVDPGAVALVRDLHLIAERRPGGLHIDPVHRPLVADDPHGPINLGLDGRWREDVVRSDRHQDPVRESVVLRPGVQRVDRRRDRSAGPVVDGDADTERGQLPDERRSVLDADAVAEHEDAVCLPRLADLRLVRDRPGLALPRPQPPGAVVAE